MDNYPVSPFLTNTYAKTLPIKMLQHVNNRPDLPIAALSALLLLALVLLISSTAP